ncbi:MAG: hypothetical protein COA44_06265 [Arcobacter sp.]|nr:MAG: hypothetical protein COA44_06265 [Arcobacter sp.]
MITGAISYGIGWSLSATTSFKSLAHAQYGVGATTPLGSFSLTAPANNTQILIDQKAVISGDLSTVTSVTYWADNDTINLGTSTVHPFSIDIDPDLIPNGIHTIKALVSEGATLTQTNSNAFISEVDRFKLGNTYYISTTGSISGDGSIGDPWDMGSVFSGATSVTAGDVVYVNEGSYGWHKTYLAGTFLNPILFKAIGNVNILVADAIGSAHNWFQGFRPDNTTEERDYPTVARPSGFYLTQLGHSVINCVLSNVGHPAIGHWVGCEDSFIYGNIIWGTGQYGQSPDIRGSAIYAQNNIGTRKYRDNMTFRNFTNGLKPYAESGFVRGFEMDGNTSFMNASAPFTMISQNSVERSKFTNNYSYDDNNASTSATRFGYNALNFANTGLEITDNVLMCSGRSQTGALDIRMFNNLTVKRNTIITEYTLVNTETPRLLQHYPTATETSIDWDNNAYWGGRDVSIGSDNVINDHTDHIVNDYHGSFEAWKTARPTYDINSTHTRTYPIANASFLRPNLYERGRGHITIYNWESLLTVNIDISSFGFEDGEAYEVRDIQNLYDVPVITGVYTDASKIVAVPMDLTTIAALIGVNAPVRPWNHMDECLVHTDIKFGTFLVIKQGVLN